jgi:hypothetical protein
VREDIWQGKGAARGCLARERLKDSVSARKSSCFVQRPRSILNPLSCLRPALNYYSDDLKLSGAVIIMACRVVTARVSTRLPQISYLARSSRWMFVFSFNPSFTRFPLLVLVNEVADPFRISIRPWLSW